jgi:hypothetical protein
MGTLQYSYDDMNRLVAGKFASARNAFITKFRPPQPEKPPV